MTQQPTTEIVKRPEEKISNYEFKMAKLLANTAVVPKALQGRPDEIFAVLMAGRAVNINGITALQSFASIDGKLSMSAELMRSLILRAGHLISFPSVTSKAVTIYGKRCDNGAECTVEYTLEDAEQAGLCEIKDGKAYARSYKGNPTSWEKYPRQLLAARATSELARMLFPDVISGISYQGEEIGGEVFTEDIESTYTTEVPIDLQEAQVVTDDIDEEAIVAAIEEENRVAYENAIASDRVEHPDQEKPDGYEYVREESNDNEPATKKEIQTIGAITAKLEGLHSHLVPIIAEARNTFYGDKSRADFTKGEAKQWTTYLRQLEKNGSQKQN